MALPSLQQRLSYIHASVVIKVGMSYYVTTVSGASASMSMEWKCLEYGYARSMYLQVRAQFKGERSSKASAASRPFNSLEGSAERSEAQWERTQ